MPPPNGLPAGWSTLPPGWSAGPPNGGVAPATDITANPNGEGTYKMAGPSGMMGIPFSNVAGAFRSGYKIDPGDQARYYKDLQYAPVPGDKPAFTMLDTGDPDVPSLGGGVVSAVKSLPGVAKGVAHLIAPPTNPAEYTSELLGPAGVPLVRMVAGAIGNEAKAGPQTLQYLRDAADPRQTLWGRTLSGARAVTSGASMINPLNPGGSAGMNEAIDQGRPNDALGEGLVQTAMLAGPEMLRGIGRGTKSLVRGNVDAPMAGTDVTPRQRYMAAKAQGVDLPVTQATNSPLLKPLDWINEGGVLSGPVREAANIRNVNALTAHSNGMLDTASRLDPETGGRAVQQPLQQHFTDLQNRAHSMLNDFSGLPSEEGGVRVQGLAKDAMDQQHADATAGYKDVSDNYGHLPADNVGDIVHTAEDIGKKNARFSVQFPSLESQRMMNVVGDAAQLGSDSQRTYLGAPQIGDLIRSRSALLDLTRDPEIVKSSYGGDIQRLIAAHDQAIMDSLPEDGRTAWRDANAKWEGMKNTFDNPSSPYFSAIRTPNPSTLATGIGGQTPEAVRTLHGVTGDEGVGIARRGVTENLLGNAPDGTYDLRNFSSRLERLPGAYRSELFGGQGEENLRGLGSDYRAMQPFEKAATTDDPESLVHGVGPKTAAGARMLRDLPIKPEGMGAVQRGTMSDLLGKTSDGGFNFKQLPNSLKNANEGYLGELLGPEQHQQLKDIGTTSRALDVDYNRSGSGKTAQKVAEFGSMTTPLPYLQYPLAKLLTSPKVADWMMRPSPPRGSPFFAPPEIIPPEKKKAAGR